MTTQDVSNGKDFAKELSSLAEELKIELKVNADALGEYVAERVSHLRFASQEPGYDKAVEAEKDNILLFATGLTVDGADALDTRLTALIAKGLVTLITVA